MAGIKGKSGGARPGAGRKHADAKKVQVTITITPDQREDLEFLRGIAVDTNAAIGREITRLADLMASTMAEGA